MEVADALCKHVGHGAAPLWWQDVPVSCAAGLRDGALAAHHGCPLVVPWVWLGPVGGAQDITGATSVDELVRMFVAAEERNYSLFRYASQINAELEQHHQAMAEVRGLPATCAGGALHPRAVR